MKFRNNFCYETSPTESEALQKKEIQVRSSRRNPTKKIPKVEVGSRRTYKKERKFPKSEIEAKNLQKRKKSKSEVETKYLQKKKKSKLKRRSEEPTKRNTKVKRPR